jgi:hypothetical protein
MYLSPMMRRAHLNQQMALRPGIGIIMAETQYWNLAVILARIGNQHHISLYYRSVVWHHVIAIQL